MEAWLVSVRASSISVRRKRMDSFWWIKINARRFAPLTSGNTRSDLVSSPRKLSSETRSDSVATESVTNTPRDSFNRRKIGASGRTFGNLAFVLGNAYRQTAFPRSNITTETRGAFRASINSCAVNCKILPSSSKPLSADEKRLSSARRCERWSSSLARLMLSSNSLAFSKAIAAWLAKVVPTCKFSRL